MTQRNDLLNNINAFNWLMKKDKVYDFIEEIEVDVLVIGSGHSGTAAARSCIETNPNRRIMVVDQQDAESFRVLGSGEIGHINSKWQKNNRVPLVDVPTFIEDWQLRTQNRSAYGLISDYANNCGDCFDWMIEVLDEDEIGRITVISEKVNPHMPVLLNGYRSYPGSAKLPMDVQKSLMKKNRDYAEALGVAFKYNTKADELIREGEKVIGAILKNKVGYVKVNVNKAIVLAAGDYSRNPQMCRDLITEAADMIDQKSQWLGQGWQGDGLRLGMIAGGRMESRPHCAIGGNYAFPGFEVIGGTPVLRVNSHGQRYSNEGFGNHVLAATTGAKQPNGMIYGVFDSDVLEQIRCQTHSHAFFDYSKPEKLDKLKSDLKRARESGTQGVPISAVCGKENPNMPRRLYCGETIEALSGCMYKDKDDQVSFIESVKRYNEMCSQGKDVDFGKDRVLLHNVERPPFYAVGQLKDNQQPIGQSYKLLITVGGLLINRNQQVLSDCYEPISGLFATGNSSGNRFGTQYAPSMSGQSISMAQTLGRELGRYLAK